MLKIQSKRFGFACNSSSTHSCVVLQSDIPFKKLERKKNKQYGWRYFTITDKQEIKEYFYLMLYSQLSMASSDIMYTKEALRYDLPCYMIDSFKQLFLKEYLPKEILDTFDLDENSEINGFVDHQSCLRFPSSKRNLIPDCDFAIKLIDEVANTPNIAILGGNDNDDKDHKLLNYSTYYDHPILDVLPEDGRYAQWIRYDESGFYSFFDPTKGNKIRFTFDKNVTIYQSSVPELVDLKITDYCTKGCHFCYQSSTQKGIHGNFYDIETIIKNLAKLGCFEVAIGGGEPTEHPRFVDILQVAKDNNIIANFTTKSTQWLKDLTLAKQIFELTGAIALSISSVAELDKFLNLIAKVKGIVTKPKLTAQIVLGTMPKKKLIDLLDKCSREHIRITLLGFKSVGFGNSYDIIPYDSWIDDVIIQYSNSNIAIDSKLLAEREDTLIERGLDKLFLTDSEGLFSCYIDAVKMTLSKDSYSVSTNYDISYGYSDRILSAFKTMQSELRD